MIPFSKPTLGKEEEQAALRVIRSGWLAAGKETEAFEKEFSDYISPKEIASDGDTYVKEQYYAIFTNSCTSALKMAYKYYREQGYTDYELSDLNTYCATYVAAEEIGLNQLISGSDYLLEDVIRVNIHYGGKLDNSVCDIEDSAHRIEPNDPLIGKIRCYSFYVTKNMTTGSGGMLVTNDKDIYETCRIYWRDGLTTSTADRAKGLHNYSIVRMAGGYDGNDLAAAIGREQLKKLPEFTKRRNEIVERYNRELKQSWTGNHLYPYFVKYERIEDFIRFMRDKGIMCGYHYPNTGWNGVSLPLYPLLSDDEVDYIIKCVKEYKC